MLQKIKLSHCTTGSSLSSVIRSCRLRGSACALPLTHDVHHGWKVMCAVSCFVFSTSKGSHGAEVIRVPVLASILSSSTGSKTPYCTTASFSLGEFCFFSDMVERAPSATFGSKTHLKHPPPAHFAHSANKEVAPGGRPPCCRHHHSFWTRAGIHTPPLVGRTRTVMSGT